jgi:hypothetical protein
MLKRGQNLCLLAARYGQGYQDNIAKENHIV